MPDAPMKSLQFVAGTPIAFQLLEAVPWDKFPGLKKVANTIALCSEIGIFHVACSDLDQHTDFAIYKFLKVTPQEAHLLTSGMMFGRKSRLLADLIGRSHHPRKAALLGAFNAVRANKRDIITHGHMISDEGNSTVTFIERSISGEFKAKEHSFTIREFFDYIHVFAKQCQAFSVELGVSEGDITAFSKAALSLNRKS